MKRARFYRDGSYVVVEYTDHCTGDRVVERLTAPEQYGYVRDHAGKQVCERLASTGPTLMSSRAALLDCVRREYRRMRALERLIS